MSKRRTILTLVVSFLNCKSELDSTVADPRRFIWVRRLQCSVDKVLFCVLSEYSNLQLFAEDQQDFVPRLHTYR